MVRGGSGGVEWYQMLGVARGEVFVPVVRREEGGTCVCFCLVGE